MSRGRSLVEALAAAALGDADPPPPPDSALAEGIALGRRGQERERFVQAIRVVEGRPGDIGLPREPRDEPVRHREAERIVERGMGDTGVVQTSVRGSPEPIDSRGEVLERTVDQREKRRVVRVRLQKAQGLVKTKQRRRVAHDGAAELFEEL